MSVVFNAMTISQLKLVNNNCIVTDIVTEANIFIIQGRTQTVLFAFSFLALFAATYKPTFLLLLRHLYYHPFLLILSSASYVCVRVCDMICRTTKIVYDKIVCFYRLSVISLIWRRTASDVINIVKTLESSSDNVKITH